MRTTVILKTDIVDSTPKTAALTQAEMGFQRKQHKRLISETTSKNHGSIFEEEGDAFWIEFPSVTTAVLAAIEMHQTLQVQQSGKGEKHRLAIRAVITVGDIFYQGSDTLGTTLALTARIEKITPPNEIYLSQAAWLIFNKAEFQTEFVNEFRFKGFSEPERVYRVVQKHRTRVLTNQYIVFTDVRSWISFTKSREIADVENFLMEYDDLLNEICDGHGGVIRNRSGDEYFITFSEADRLFPAIQKLCIGWRDMLERYQLGLSITIHHGNLNILRSYLYGEDINTTFFLEELIRSAHPDGGSISVITSGKVKESVKGMTWDRKLEKFDLSVTTDERIYSTVKEHGAYWFIYDDASPNNRYSSY